LTLPDLLKLLQAMADALRISGPHDWAAIGPIIGVRFSGVRSIGTSGSASAIEGGSLVESGLAVDGVFVEPPRSQISLLFPDKALSEPNISRQQFATDQRVIKSRSGRGYAITFPVRGVECAILVGQPGEYIEGLTARVAKLPGDGVRKD
jgi:hypothetical protein